MPALYAGKRVGKPLMGGHTYNALFNGKLVWPLDKDTVVSIEITDDKGNALPKSLAVNGSLKLGAKATYADGHVGDLLPTKGVTFTSRDTSTATVSGSRGGMAARFSSPPLSTVSLPPPCPSARPTHRKASGSRTIPASRSMQSPCA